MSPPASEAIKIKSSHPEHNGHMIIDSADFDPAVHERFIDPPPPPPIPPPPPCPPAGPLDNLTSDWREQDYGTLRRIAISVCDGRTPENRKQAVQMIEAALKART